MINHWARTPENGYLGSDYGGSVILKKYLNEPQAELAINLIAKLQKDVPYFQSCAVSVKPQTENSLIITVDNEAAVVSTVA